MLKHLPSVEDQKLVVGGPSITTPVARSKGFHFCLLSYHKDRQALHEYQASPEHHQYENFFLLSDASFSANAFYSVTSTYMWPFNDDLMRFDFEVNDESNASQVPFLFPRCNEGSRAN